ncbi:MAG: GNAT family N-acetyltransferase [Oscillospiraceae bacterium]|jgi:GNAT superfamily N-acetyltransferase|nr:GNAT family N-acetyltransferase [Oscillospiraceae bacterium]
MLEIKALVPELVSDYLDFFDNRAFSDGTPNGPCYCTSPNMDISQIYQMVSEFGTDAKGVIRRYAVKLLDEGKIHGYLAFDGGMPVGWCNAGDRNSYAGIDNFTGIIPKDVCGRTLSVVCFAIAPEYRGQGVAAALLNRAIADAETAGFAAVEGYARLQKERADYDYNGPVRLYEKAGFVEAQRQNGRVLMRKYLKQ